MTSGDVQKLANEGTKKCLELAAKVKGVRDEARAYMKEVKA